MLIREKIETIYLTDAKQAVADLILAAGPDIESMTARDIAAHVGTVPSLISRFSIKLGYNGWNAFRKEWVKESRYLLKTNQKIDANLPFAPKNGMKEVSARLSALMEQAIQETHSLLDFGNLQRAADLLCRSSRIYCLGVSDNAWLLESFASKMR
ncbi:MAG: MurR/RpiR family transcriptional regulator [Erysipelotrichaceae bacterium]|nr:MurR/RpiR family transcriptional regulator [Erysipelotrichaceae bacterium]